MQWIVLFNKEVVENWRNKKWIWVPLVLILIAIMDPISYYYLPQILELSGGVPEGTVIEIPPLTPSDVLMMSLEQLSVFGVLIIVLVSMGTIASERKSGITEIILVKPIYFTSYITSKWLSHVLLGLFALFLGLMMGWYYTNLLFGELSFLILLKTTLFYGLWFMLVVTISIFFNSFLKNGGLVAAMTILTVILMSICNQIVGHKLVWFPNQLSAHLYEMILTGTVSKDLIITSIIIVCCIVILIISAIQIFKRIEKSV